MIGGLDVGGTKCAVVVARPGAAGCAPEVLARCAFPTREHAQPEALLAYAAERLRELASEPLTAVGVACGGPLDANAGLVLGPPNLPGWEHVPLVRLLSAHLDVPVTLENDADACALAEWRWGSGVGTQHLAYVTCGTGFGAGLILGGRLHRGHGGAAGEIGHIRADATGPWGHGRRGTFEGWCSGGGLAAAVRDLAGVPGAPAWAAAGIDAAQLAVLARAGDQHASDVWSAAGERLGRAVALVIDLLAPEVIALGPLWLRASDLLRPAAEAAWRREALPASLARCRIVPAGLGERIGDLAALAAIPDILSPEAS